MSSIDVSPDEIRKYGNAAAATAGELAHAGSLDQAANMAALAPVFGLVGAEFLARFATAQADHALSFLGVARHFAATARLVHANADAYERADRDAAASMTAIAQRLEALR